MTNHNHKHHDTPQKKRSFLSNLTTQIIIAMIIGAVLGIIIHNNSTPEGAKE